MKKVNLVWLNVLILSLFCAVVFGYFHFSTNLVAKESVSLILVEEAVLEGQTFHLAVDSQSQKSEKELVLKIPEGIKFNGEYDEAYSKTGESVVQWLQEQQQLLIRIPLNQSLLELPFIAETSGEFLFVLSETGNDDSQIERNIIVEDKVEPGEPEHQKEDTALTDLAAVYSKTTSGEVDISQYPESQIANVTDWAGFARAFANRNIAVINITESFAIPSNPRAGLTDVLSRDSSNVSGGSRYVHTTGTGTARKVTVEGNDNIMDFGSVSFLFENGNFTGVPATQGWDITWQNLEVYHGNIYGFTTLNDLSATNQQRSKVTYHDITNHGNQMIHSPSTDVVFSGKTSNIQAATYTSPFHTNWAIGGVNQINLMITNLTILPNAEITLSTLRAGNVLLRDGGSLVLGKDSTMNVIGSPVSTTGESDAAHTNLRVQGSVTLDEGATLNLVPKANYSALSLINSGNFVNIGKGAAININSTGHTTNTNSDNRNLVYLASGSRLTVDEEGSLAIAATGMGSSNSHIIHALGSARFTVEKRGNFSVESDSTSTSQRLVNFAAAGTFSFTDAMRVNLARTNTISGTGSNGLISSTGSLNVSIQKVSMWDRGELEETPTMSWTPMYGVVLGYSGTTSTVREASSLTTEVESSFRNNFSTTNKQRVLFEFIPEVEVSILSEAVDLQTESGAATVYGTTNLGAYVRLTYTPPAGGKINVFSFKDGKKDVKEQIVKDITHPSGDAKEFYAGQGAAVPDPSVFVQNPTDTNPFPQAFSYEYSDENDQQAMATLMNQVGTHTVFVNLLDDAGNKTKIESRLIILASAEGISGQDFEVSYADICDLTEAELTDYILTNSAAEAFKLTAGIKTDLSRFITVSDFGGLNDVSNLQAQEYTVSLVVRAADSGLPQDITTTIKVTVIDVEAVLTVEFVNEANQVLSGYTITIDTRIGDTIDLKQQSAVAAQLTNLEMAGYEIAQRPENEENVWINNLTMTVQYRIQGLLTLTSAPDSLDFGTLTYNATTKRIDNPTFEKGLVVTDTRANPGDGWNVTATLSTPMINQDGKELVNALRYVYNGEETILNSNALPVYLNTNGTSGALNISDTWGDSIGTDGVKLQIESSDVIYTGNYVGVITWKMMAGQP